MLDNQCMYLCHIPFYHHHQKLKLLLCLLYTSDKNIDFRRVRNLNVYFKRHALSLTLDIYDLDKWQGGDIVIFKKHIGIVSNYRNKKGITFVIHHAYPHQFYYEEDILEKRNDIIGHYRIS